jgi:hypothetical protein
MKLATLMLGASVLAPPALAADYDVQMLNKGKRRSAWRSCSSR